MKKLTAIIICLVMLIVNIALIASAYSTQSESRPALEEIFAKVKYLGDANHDGSIFADDARAILRYSADLDPDIDDELTAAAQSTLNIDGDDNIRALDRDLIYDIDGDGDVTAIDARIALRISANFESLNTYRQKFSLELFNASINNIKVPTSVGSYGGLKNFYYGEEKKTDQIMIGPFLMEGNNIKYKKDEYNNYILDEFNHKIPEYSYGEAALTSFSNQMNTLIGTMDNSAEPIDLADSLKQDVGVVSYTSNNYEVVAYQNSQHIPVYGFTEGSFLTANDVASIEFNDSANYNFISYYTENGVRNERHRFSMQNLYSIIVTVEPDNLSASNYPSDLVAGSHAGKVFDLPDKSNVDAAYQEIQELQAQMNSYKENSSWFMNHAALEVKKFDLRVNFTSLDVAGSTVTLYMNPETGMPVGVDYKLTYDLNVNMYMDINMQGGTLVGYNDVVVTDQNIEITNKLYTRNRIIILKNGEAFLT